MSPARPPRKSIGLGKPGSRATLLLALQLGMGEFALAMSPTELRRLEDLERAHEQQREFDRQAAERQNAQIQRDAELHEAQVRKLRELHQRLERCGSCAERAALQAELERIQAQHAEAIRLYCANADQWRQQGTAAAALIGGLIHGSPLCQLRRQEARQQLVDKARSGKPEDAHRLALWTIKEEGDVRQGCTQLEAGVSQGHGVFMRDYAHWCLGNRQSGIDAQRGEQLLQHCADQGEPECALALRNYRFNREASAQRATARSSANKDYARRPPLEAAALRRERGDAARQAAREEARSHHQERREQEQARVCDFETKRLSSLQERLEAAGNERQRLVAQRALERGQKRQESACAGG
ncbi:hypothetical protein [Inhella proteolytica]|uniref:Sel1 repeat family protein n=1 Tax=Inhella proteolytica TaxID=2795029 RepID=A0A931J177_9BURK|nr:hypothetical protein [Inhella proteolytica]MBH9576265.1 hypothetical protein [Inhella proteolytica]